MQLKQLEDCHNILPHQVFPITFTQSHIYIVPQQWKMTSAQLISTLSMQNQIRTTIECCSTFFGAIPRQSFSNSFALCTTALCGDLLFWASSSHSQARHNTLSEEKSPTTTSHCFCLLQITERIQCSTKSTYSVKPVVMVGLCSYWLEMEEQGCKERNCPL